GVTIAHRAEMAPVNLALLARGRFEADERALLGGGLAHAGEVLPDNGDPTREALLGQALTQYDGRDLGVDLQHVGDGVFEGIELTAPGTPWPWGGGIGQIFADGWSTNTESLGDLAHRQAFMGE